MGKLINLIQSCDELNVDSNIVKKIYNMIINNENYNDDPIIDSNSNIIGKISLNNPTYENWITTIRNRFPYFQFSDLSYYIRFADINVETALVNNGFGDGTGITSTDVANNLFGTIFKDNSQIVSFDELTYFTKVNRSGFSTDAFKNCTSLESINLNNLETFGNTGTFVNCENLKYFNGNESEQGTLNLPSYINSTIPNYTFNNCKCLTKIESLGNTTEIAKYAFAGCTNLTTISQTVLNKITNIGAFAFRDCSNLVINELSLPNLMILEASEGTFKNTQLRKITNLGYVSNVGCFQDSKYLTEVNLPSTCTELGRRAFYNCTALTTINLQNIETFGDSPISGCTSLEYFAGPNSEQGVVDLPNLKYGSFGAMNTKIREIRNIGSIKKLLNWGFIGCSLLTNIDNILEQLEEIADQTFWRCPNLIINDLNCPNLKKLGISNFPGVKVKKISNLGTITILQRDNFQGCTVLTDVTLPSTLTQIDGNVFNGCTALTSVTILAPTPPILTTSAFTNTTCTIYVPSASVETYKQADGWSTLASRIQAITT